MGESATQALRLVSGAATNGRSEEMTKLTDEQLLAWARTRVRMLVKHLELLARLGTKL
jgi:hypothetical protein